MLFPWTLWDWAQLLFIKWLIYKTRLFLLRIVSIFNFLYLYWLFFSCIRNCYLNQVLLIVALKCLDISAFAPSLIAFHLLCSFDRWFDGRWLNRWKLILSRFLLLRHNLHRLHVFPFRREHIIIVPSFHFWIILGSFDCLLWMMSLTFNLNIFLPIDMDFRSLYSISIC